MRQSAGEPHRKRLKLPIPFAKAMRGQERITYRTHGRTAGYLQSALANGGPMSTPHATNAEDGDSEYRSIEATLLATARGRWFLAEHGRRARRVDNALLQDAMSRIAASMREPSEVAEGLKSKLNLVREALKDVTAAVVATRTPVGLSHAADAAGQTTAQSILAASEQVHELAWTLQGREGRDHNRRTLDEIARQVVVLYALAREQASETKRRQDLLGKLAIAEERVAALIDTVDHELGAGRLPKAE